MTLLLIIRRTREECLSRQVFLMKDHVSSYGHVVTITQKIEVDTAASIEELKKTKRQLVVKKILYWITIFCRAVLLVAYSWFALGILEYNSNCDFWILGLLVGLIGAFIFTLYLLLDDFVDLQKHNDAYEAVKERLSLLEMLHR